jgi:hypothetical protein
MHRALLVVAILGALAWIVEAALLFLLPHLAQSSSYVTLATADAYLEWIVPLLGVIVGILGAVRATRGDAAVWASLFVTFTVLIVVLPVVGVLIAAATFLSRNQALEAVGTVAVEIGLLFPSVMFVNALIYAVRGGAPPGKT